MNNERIIILVCSKCKKLIGTRENYHLLKKYGHKKPYAVICEGRYENANK